MCQCQDSLFHFPLIITYVEFKEKPGRVVYRSCENVIFQDQSKNVSHFQLLKKAKKIEIESLNFSAKITG